MKTPLRLALVCVWTLSFAISAHADITLTLKKSFIAQYKDRATIEASYTIDTAHKKPNPPKKDGDIHIAGRAPEIGLATVAEVQNAASVPEALQVVKDNEGSGNPVRVVGAWRIWAEHGGTSAVHTQGAKLDAFTTTNPDHVFEIHSITDIGGVDVRNTLIPIEGFDPKDAHDAFFHYESKKFVIKPQGQSVTMTFPGVGYNYVKFVMKILGKTDVEDGTFVMASLHDKDGDLLIRQRRTVFVKDTPPEVALRGKSVDDCMVVLGLPRIDLDLVSWRAAHYNDPKYKSRLPLTWSMPYEMIVVGIYDEECAVD